MNMPTGDYVWNDRLGASFTYMSDNKMYKEMTVYFDSTESGLMFDGFLPSDKNIYALSSSEAYKLAWATYCSPDDVVNGKAIGTCLGDLFSVNWLEDADKAQWSTETLQTQFERVSNLTDRSRVQ
jgi:legumain